MKIDTLKKVLCCSRPTGISSSGDEKRIAFSYESLAAGARLVGVEIPSKRETFRMLREIGFSDAKSDDEVRIAAPLLTMIAILVPVAKDVLEQLERESKS